MEMVGKYFMVDQYAIEQIQSGKKSVVAKDWLYIDMVWHAIHFTLSRIIDEEFGKNPLSKVVLGGRVLAEEDWGVHPIRYLSAKDVGITNTALQKVTDEEFKSKFDVTLMRENNIYPVTEAMDNDAFLEYAMGYLPDIREFFESAAQSDGFIIFSVNRKGKSSLSRRRKIVFKL